MAGRPPPSGSNPAASASNPGGSNSNSGSATPAASGSGGSSQPPQTTSIPDSLPVGGATITQPPQTVTSFYKIAPNNIMTIGWNLTYVVATPTSITMSAYCANGNAYAVGPDPDGHVPGTATQVFWDLYSYQQAHPNTPLPQASCTLHMWDDRGPSAPRQAGLMTPNTQLAFALYTPQAYTPLADGWSCTGCSSALAVRPAFAALFITLLVMLVSGARILGRRL